MGTDELEETFINPLTNKPYPCIALIKDTNDIRRASNNGEPLVYSPNNDFTKSIGKIVSQIVDEEHALEQPGKERIVCTVVWKARIDMSFSQSSSPTLMKEQYQKKENEKQRIIEKVGSEHVQPTKEEQDYATDVIKIISEQFSEDLITKNLDDLDAPIRRAIAAECEKLQVTFEVQKRIEKTVGMMVLGNGPIEEYLQDPEVTEIVVQRYDNIVVERHGKVEPVPTIFNSEAHLQTIIKRIVQKVNRQINIGHPIVDGTASGRKPCKCNHSTGFPGWRNTYNP